jgi:hypothetical protein
MAAFSMAFTRREFLGTSLRAGLALPASRMLPAPPVVEDAPIYGLPDPARGIRGDSSLGAALRLGGELPPVSPLPRRLQVADAPLALRYPDLARHFVFEYYPWYASDPFRHWQQDGRHPPFDVATNLMPRLGPYDSRAAAVIEQHARWIAECGAGAINMSWWGQGSFEDRIAPLVLDVMKDHGLKVTFHLEPYTPDHGLRFADDVRHLLHEYGEKRHYDAFLILRDEGGAEGPVFKGFRTLLPTLVHDCHGVSHPVRDYTPDDAFRQQFDALRTELRGDFDHLTLLSDTTDARHAGLAGFDGIAIYDNFIGPARYAALATRSTTAGVVFSLNTNPGFDGIEPRTIPAGGCYQPTPLAPPGPELDFSDPGGRERAATRDSVRIRQSFDTTLALQTDPGFSNDKRGFLLVYLNSFNEWHEGHAFEPMKDAAELLPEERAFGYHNPEHGAYRLELLSELLRGIQAPPPQDAVSRRAQAVAPAGSMG